MTTRIRFTTSPGLACVIIRSVSQWPGRTVTASTGGPVAGAAVLQAAGRMTPGPLGGPGGLAGAGPGLGRWPGTIIAAAFTVATEAALSHGHGNGLQTGRSGQRADPAVADKLDDLLRP